MPRRRDLRYWSDPGRAASKELAYNSPESPDLREQIDRDEEQLLAALRGRADYEKLSLCVKRLKSNAECLGFFDGFGSGSKIAKERLSKAETGDNAKIIALIRQKPFAGPTEIAEMIDEYNFRAREDHKPTIGWPFKGLATGHERRWTENVAVPRVKQRLADLKRKAWRSMYAAQLNQPRFLRPAESATRQYDSDEGPG
jgi:hypothetical protein